MSEHRPVRVIKSASSLDISRVSAKKSSPIKAKPTLDESSSDDEAPDMSEHGPVRVMSGRERFEQRRKMQKKAVLRSASSLDISQGRCVIDVSTGHSLFAEILPWVLLSVYVDLPLQLRFLRANEKEGNNEDVTLKQKLGFLSPWSKFRYRFSARYFLVAVICSSIENIVMFRQSMDDLRSPHCRALNGTKLITKIESDRACGIYYPVNKTQKICATFQVESEDSQTFSESLFKYGSANADAFLQIFVVLICLKFTVVILLFFFVWIDIGSHICGTYTTTSTEKEKNARSSILLRRHQAIGRQLGQSKAQLLESLRVQAEKRSIREMSPRGRNTTMERPRKKKNRKSIRRSITETNLDIATADKRKNNLMEKYACV